MWIQMPEDDVVPVAIKDRSVLVWWKDGTFTEARLVDDSDFGWCWESSSEYLDLNESTHYMIIEPPL